MIFILLAMAMSFSCCTPAEQPSGNKPGGEGTVPLEGGQRPPDLEKDLLGHIGGILRIAQQPQRLMIDLLFIAGHQLAEGGLIALLSQND